MNPTDQVGDWRPTGWFDDLDRLNAFVADDRRAPDDRPWILSNMVSTLDGSAVGPDGRSGALAGPDDRQALIGYRSIADAIIVGAGTARTEGYRSPRFRKEILQQRLDAGADDLPLLVLVSNSARFAIEPSLVAFGKRLVLAVPTLRAEMAAEQYPEATLLLSPGDQVDLHETLRQLRSLGVHIALTEGGPTLLGAMLAAHVVDEYNLTLAPRLSGNRRTPVTGSTQFDSQQWRLHRSVAIGDDLFLRYLTTSRRS